MYALTLTLLLLSMLIFLIVGVVIYRMGYTDGTKGETEPIKIPQAKRKKQELTDEQLKTQKRLKDGLNNIINHANRHSEVSK